MEDGLYRRYVNPPYRQHVLNVPDIYSIDRQPANPDRISSDISGVYVLWHEDGTLLYIGKATNVRGRLTTHLQERSFLEAAWERKRTPPEHIHHISIIQEDSPLGRDLLETALINEYPTVWNFQKKISWDDSQRPVEPHDPVYHSDEAVRYRESRLEREERELMSDMQNFQVPGARKTDGQD